MSDHELMALHADILFTYDARGRMRSSNDPDAHPAPRVFLGCAADRYIVRLGQTVPDTVAQRVAELIEEQSPIGTPRIPSAVLDAVQEELERQAPITAEGGGPVYRFPASIPLPFDVVQLTRKNVRLARETFPWLIKELADWWPCFAVVRDGSAVSICFSSRIGSRACEAGVETLSAFRGRGYAAAVTAAWGTSIRSVGRIPLYSTSWDNLASQGVAGHLGLTMIGSDATWT